jgi:hypothetical protein
LLGFASIREEVVSFPFAENISEPPCGGLTRIGETMLAYQAEAISACMNAIKHAGEPASRAHE